jgi:rhodanese-related sulfurtransferase
VALLLDEQGYRARALTGGYDGWREAGLPLEPLAAVASETPA